MCLALSRSRRIAFTGSNDGQGLRAWALPSGACLAHVGGFGCAVSAMSWHIASHCLATGTEDGTVSLWDTATLEGEAPELRQIHSLPLDQPQGLHVEVVCLTPSADGTALFCGLDDGNIVLLS